MGWIWDYFKLMWQKGADEAEATKERQKKIVKKIKKKVKK